MSPILKSLAAEKIVRLKSSQKLPFTLDAGVVRLVDSSGNTVALMLDRATLADIEEDAAASTSEFAAALASSRKSGRVACAKVKRNPV